jgi:NAD(P)-dependent dehydrogenase (short-subunit alcohol dehydrogenase family)
MAMADTEQPRVALVTGAGSGIGRASAVLLAGARYAVALVDRDEAAGREIEAQLRGSGARCAFIPCDVANDDQVRRTVAETVARFGRLDMAFNAAGIESTPGALTDPALVENWHRVIAVNLTGVWQCMRHELPAIQASGGGSIVNCASIAGTVGAPYIAGYVAAKHGVVGLTKAAALEYAREGVRINAVCPGIIDTPMQHRGVDPVEHAAMIEASPPGRMGSAKEVAEAVLWLASDGASFVNGQMLAVDGGWTAR